MFITFEGVDGSGKSTQAKALVEYLNSIGKKAVFTREPGGTILAEKLRDIILSDHIEDALTEFMIICAARRDHVKNFISPKLQDGEYVICDRFLDSSLVYQGYAKGLDLALIKQLHTICIGPFFPDITFVLDVPYSIASSRIERLRDQNNHYDSKGALFFDSIQRAFLEIANSKPRYHLINGTKSQDEIQQKIIDMIAAKQPL